jgi:predicted outer membrane protein
MVYTMAIGSRFKSKTSEFGVPLHRWAGTGTVLLLLIHVLLAMMVSLDNLYILTIFNAPAKGAAGMSALVCIGLALCLGEFRTYLKFSPKRWRFFHVLLSWSAGIFALAHILWIDQLVNDPLWLVLFMCIGAAALIMWLTRAKGVSVTSTGMIPRFAKWALVIAALIAVVAVIFSWKAPDALTVGYTQNPLGPIGPSDRDMLYKVKQAGLWEMPVGEEAASRAVTTQFRDVAAKIAVEHHQLDARVTEVAQELGIQLPAEVTPDQARWMQQISASSSGEYDRTAVMLLRQAHGKVLPLLAQVRSSSRNAVVRGFADEAMEYVNRHIGYLDSTGLVNYAQLPEAPPPNPYQQPAEASYLDSRDFRTVIVGVVVVGIIAALITALIFSLRKTHPTPKVSRPAKVGPRHAKAK